MGYRIEDHKPKPPRRDVQGATSPATVFVQNGSTLDYALPCWYLIVDPPMRAHCHSRQHHDHVGWPSPTHPDHICQDWEFAHSCHEHDNDFHHHHGHHDHHDMYIDPSKLAPIHLLDEGYTDIEVAFDDKPDGLFATGYIDAKRDWIIRINIDSMVADAIKDRIDVPYSVFASGNGRRDVVGRGVIAILPGPIGD